MFFGSVNIIWKATQKIEQIIANFAYNEYLLYLYN